MPDWYPIIVNARYARMSPVEFARLPMAWQEAIDTARVAEIEASQHKPEQEDVG